MSDLPHVIIVDILSRLPVKSLLRFRCVCKPWCNLVSDPSFIKMHLKRATANNNLSLLVFGDSASFRMCSNHLSDKRLYSIDSDAFDEAVEIDYPLKSPVNGSKIWASCNGLVCIANKENICEWNPSTREYITTKEDICLWNPSTREYKMLPSTYSVDHFIVYGLGYDRIIDDYKLVRIAYIRENDDHSLKSEVKVYTLGSSSWRRIGNIPYKISYEGTPGIFSNGALHWVANSKYEMAKLIIAFDIRNEKYREVPLPDHVHDNDQVNVVVLRGCLCLFNNSFDFEFEMWVMKDYSVRESWTKLFTIERPTAIRSLNNLRLFGFSKNGEILRKDGEALVFYDPKQKRARNLKIHGVPYCFEIETYVGSLVSLQAGTYVGSDNGVKRRRRPVSLV